MASRATENGSRELLIQAVHSTPIIDHHAHPLLRLASSHKSPLLSITTEAHGSALAATPTSLAHLRAVRQLSDVLGCEPKWNAVSSVLEGKRQVPEEYDEWVATCLSGIQSVLVDDYLGDQSANEDYSYFDQFTTGEAKRIVRIEQVAAELIDEACVENKSLEIAFSSFMVNLEKAIVRDIGDPVVVGFKSAICYRTGLNIPEQRDDDKAYAVFQGIHTRRRQSGSEPFTRLDHEGLNEYVVHCLAKFITESAPRHLKPIQFHTGLGDNDINLTRSSPAHLQPFIEQYPQVPIVLLHSGYPFVRETAYLATVFANVYADIGEVFPMVSRDGQEKVIRQTLELCPYSKMLWSTDGHCHPETFFLAVKQMRRAFEKVLVDYVTEGDLTWAEAKDCVEAVLFHNANELYSLELSIDSPSSAPTPRTESESLPECTIDGLAALTKLGESVQHVRVCWQDMTGTNKTRIFPIRRALKLLQSSKELKGSISTTALGVLQNDQGITGTSPSGEWDLVADFNTLREGTRNGHVTLFGNFRQKDGSTVPLCPRSLLQQTLNRASSHGLSFILGFEIEFVLLSRAGPRQYKRLGGDAHSWCSLDAADHAVAVDAIEEAISKLDKAGIYLEMMHPESAFGQYEIVLPAVPALEAVDTLLYARQVLAACATAHGLKMTLHPKPFPDETGTASHVHMSISSSNGSDPALYEPFYAGILHHLRSIIAYTCANPVSYLRMVDGFWAGGTWVTWGRQNREAPLRMIEGSHWEVKCMDGVGNPYLAMAAILSSGLEGVLSKRELVWKECSRNPALLSTEEKEELHITEKLPSTLDEALDSLEKDGELREMLGEESVERFLAVKRGEIGLLAEMDAAAQRQWVIERY